MKWVIFGLGNPGEIYKNTRHNLGRDLLDEFAKKNNEIWKKFNIHGEYFKIKNNDNEIFFLKTTTLFMNESGILIKEFIDFYKIDTNNIIIIYDEMDYPLGQFKLRENGSGGGHNGMKDIIKYLNTSDIKRIRIGIGRPKFNVKDFVLGKFGSNEKAIIDKVKNELIKIIELIINDENFKTIMNKFNV